jgi:hypothetical protein
MPRVQEPKQRVFMYVDVAGGADPAVPVPDPLPGVMGTFLGATEDTFVVLESSKLGADNIAVYQSGPDFAADALLGYTYVELATGDSVTGLWQGPPAAHLLQARACVAHALKSSAFHAPVDRCSMRLVISLHKKQGWACQNVHDFLTNLRSRSDSSV